MNPSYSSSSLRLTRAIHSLPLGSAECRWNELDALSVVSQLAERIMSLCVECLGRRRWSNQPRSGMETSAKGLGGLRGQTNGSLFYCTSYIP